MLTETYTTVIFVKTKLMGKASSTRLQIKPGSKAHGIWVRQIKGLINKN